MGKVICLIGICCLFSVGRLFSQDLAEITLIDSISVSFHSGSSVIPDPSKLISRLNETTILHGKIQLIAYTDTVGSVSYNKSLASKRLLAVSGLIDSTGIKRFMRDSTNQNEERTGTGFNDGSYRRVDILIYSITPKIKLGVPVNLKINFDSGTANIVKNSMAQVHLLQVLMEMDPTLQIKLNGHVCCRPNLILSLHRAEKVKAYLMKHGIDASRISCNGYSNTVKLVPETSEENNKKNMRVEVIFVK